METEKTQYLYHATARKASDIFLVAGRPITLKVQGQLENFGTEKLMPDKINEMISYLYHLAGDRDMHPLIQKGDDDFSFSVRGLSRFRVNTYQQRNSLAAVIRLIAFELPNPQDLNIPEEIMQAADFNKGLVLITGPAGCGKSTTMACMVDRINHTRSGHIITLEDPLEYIHKHDKCIVSQRELSTDTESFLVSLRACMRQSPDVILLGEMRDLETIQTAMTAAETGHLVLSSLHTIGAANTIGRIMDVFDLSHQRQVAMQLSLVLQAVVSQQLIPDVNGHNVPVFEIMRVTPAIRNLIRENKVYQIDGIVYSSNQQQMRSMDNHLVDLCKKGIITKETAVNYSTNPEMLKKKL